MPSSSKKTKKKPKSKSYYIKKADSLWAKVTKLQADNKCEVCGRKTGLNSHHIFSRSNKRMRYNLNNCSVLCVSHHVWGDFSAHKSPLEMLEFLKEKRGEDWYNDLRDSYNEPPEPLTIEYYKNVITALTEIYESLT